MMIVGMALMRHFVPPIHLDLNANIMSGCVPQVISVFQRAFTVMEKWIVKTPPTKLDAVSQPCFLCKFSAELENCCVYISAPPIIIISPPPTVITEISYTFIINCTALGIPTPEIVWRLNWGHVPDKCAMTSTATDGNRAFGELVCPDAVEADQGAYSCEAINIKGSCFAGSPGCGQPGQDAVLVVQKPQGICPRNSFNSAARYPQDCLQCFCFGITDECSGTELFASKVNNPSY
jgi:hypothetical protein